MSMAGLASIVMKVRPTALIGVTVSTHICKYAVSQIRMNHVYGRARGDCDEGEADSANWSERSGSCLFKRGHFAYGHPQRQVKHDTLICDMMLSYV